MVVSGKRIFKPKGRNQAHKQETRQYTNLSSDKEFKKQKAAVRRRKEREKKQGTKNVAKPSSSNNRSSNNLTSNHSQDNNADYGGGFEQRSTAPKRRTIRTTWGKYTVRTLVRWYVVALAAGEPQLSLTDPKQHQSTCQCPKKKKIVTLYMMCGKLAAFYCMSIDHDRLFYSPCY